MTVIPQKMDKMQALAFGNHVRASNSLLREQVAGMTKQDGVAHVIGIIENPVGPAGAMPVARLLMSVQRLGDVKACYLLTRAGSFSTALPATRRVRELTDRQRCALVRELRRWAS